MSIKTYIATGLVLGASLIGCKSGPDKRVYRDFPVKDEKFDIMFINWKTQTYMTIGHLPKNDNGFDYHTPILETSDNNGDGIVDKIECYNIEGSDLVKINDINTLSELEQTLKKDISKDSTGL